MLGTGKFRASVSLHYMKAETFRANPTYMLGELDGTESV